VEFGFTFVQPGHGAKSGGKDTRTSTEPAISTSNSTNVFNWWATQDIEFKSALTHILQLVSLELFIPSVYFHLWQQSNITKLNFIPSFLIWPFC